MMYPDVLREQINTLNKNLDKLSNEIKNGSKSSNRLQKWIIFWTCVMALAVVGQIITIILTSA